MDENILQTKNDENQEINEYVCFFCEGEHGNNTECMRND